MLWQSGWRTITSHAVGIGGITVASVSLLLASPSILQQCTSTLALVTIATDDDHDVELSRSHDNSRRPSNSMLMPLNRSCRCDTTDSVLVPMLSSSSSSSSSSMKSTSVKSESTVKEEFTTTTATTTSNLKQKHRVLVVGSGLSGCLAALRIRQRWNEAIKKEEEDAKRKSSIDDTKKKKELHLDVMERATYPAGRFGAVATYQGAIADLGAQVLSILNPNDPRAKGGHGVTPDNITLAHNIVLRLSQKGIIQPLLVSGSAAGVNNRNHNNKNDELSNGTGTKLLKLSPTEERMEWEGLWTHHIAPQGMVSVLQELLKEANVHPIFGVKVDSIGFNHDRNSDNTQKGTIITVNGLKRSILNTTDKNNTKETNNNKKSLIHTNMDEADRTNHVDTNNIEAEYDCVVICVPAPDALSIQGVEDCLSDQGKAILTGVAYDSRVVEAHFFQPTMRSVIAKAFKSRGDDGDNNDTFFLERNVDGEGIGLHLLSFQDAKRQQQLAVEDINDKTDQTTDDTNYNENCTPCAIVVHRSANTADFSNESVDKIISKLTKTVPVPATSEKDVMVMSQNEIAQNRLHVKRIHWHESQMITPMEAVIADPHLFDPPLQCLEGSVEKVGSAAAKRVILAGDYMSQSSFLGCTASADAAARSVVSVLLGPRGNWKKVTDDG